MKKIQHKKYKNPGILFELLSKQVTWDVLSGDNNTSMGIIRKYFRKGTSLHEALKLYKSIINAPKMKGYKATKLVELLFERYKLIDSKQLNRELYNLIGEVKNNYEFNNFINGRIKNFKVYASIYKVLQVPNLLNESNGAFDLTDEYSHIIDFLTTEDNQNVGGVERQLSLIERQDPDIKRAAFKTIINRFNEKYASLNENQKLILSKYITENVNLTPFKNFIIDEVNKIEKILTNSLNEIKDDNLRIKVTGTIPLLNEIRTTRHISEVHVSALIKYYELIDTVKRIYG